MLWLRWLRWLGWRLGEDYASHAAVSLSHHDTPVLLLLDELWPGCELYPLDPLELFELDELLELDEPLEPEVELFELLVPLDPLEPDDVLVELVAGVELLLVVVVVEALVSL